MWWLIHIKENYGLNLNDQVRRLIVKTAVHPSFFLGDPLCKAQQNSRGRLQWCLCTPRILQKLSQCQLPCKWPADVGEDHSSHVYSSNSTMQQVWRNSGHYSSLHHGTALKFCALGPDWRVDFIS